MKPVHYRQGDVLLVQVDVIPKTAAKKDNIIARGETTGHCHQFFDAAAVVVSFDAATDQQFVHVSGQRPADLVHEEHNTIHVQPGKYAVRVQREYTMLDDVRQVAD